MKIAAFFGGAILCCSTPAVAQETGFFAGIDGGAAFRSGSPGTSSGGAAYAGGATLRDVDFDIAYSVGGHIGYRFNSQVSTFISYEHIRGDVSWTADFADPIYGFTLLSGEALSDVIMANARYTHPVTHSTALNLGVGVGVAINRLDGVAETLTGGVPISKIADGTTTALAARAMVGVEHKINDAVSIGSDVAVAHYGGFRTGGERYLPGTEPIGPYKIDDVWGGTVSAFVKIRF